MSVSVTVRDFQGGAIDVELFSCSATNGTGHGIPSGNYDMELGLLASTGPLVTAPTQHGIHISAGKTTPLAPVTFAIDATGALDLHLASTAPGGNCALTTMNGAGITGTTITLEHISSVCAPVTFTVGADATRPAFSYTVNCATPVVAACIESDQALDVSGVPSGHYVVHVRGRTGAGTCWTNDDQLVVPAVGRTLMQTLALTAGTPGC